MVKMAIICSTRILEPVKKTKTLRMEKEAWQLSSGGAIEIDF